MIEKGVVAKVIFCRNAFFILEKGLIVYTILFILQLLKRLQFGDERL